MSALADCAACLLPSSPGSPARTASISPSCLLAKGYEVYGLIRGQNNPKLDLVRSLLPDVDLHTGDLTDMSSLIRALRDSDPDEVYNLGAISFVAYSWENAALTTDVTGKGVLTMLEALRLHMRRRARPGALLPGVELGDVRQGPGAPQRETTLLWPRSPYGVAKVFGHYMTINYRESYGMHASSGHPLQPRVAAARPGVRDAQDQPGRRPDQLGLQDDLTLGNLDAQRDWGFAGDYVDAMWRMLQQDEADDYVIATGETHSIRELLDVAFAPRRHRRLGAATSSRTRASCGRPRSTCSSATRRKAREQLGWKPTVSLRRAGHDDGRRRPRRAAGRLVTVR